ncbi:protein-disulfide isomerase [Mycetocola sp. CAN_C7]|uniref:thioredoxin family protein n=1 Tax=Mycetocola sp. CAN_C7 TaxID=2787724 RepID=UPI0018CAD7BA
MQLVLYTSAFCAPCAQARAVLADAARLVPQARIVERDVARDNAIAADDGIRMTPTVVVLDDSDTEVFRATGVPTLNQVLAAAAKAL